ncbi:MAG: hypothetical protein GY851_08375 [bacterium]|nr:hypothetical protein [bacterium]
MTQHLPERPSLEHLKKQAKDLRRAHGQGDASACGVLRHLRQFDGMADADILAGDLSLTDAQYALAMECGFSSWNALKEHVLTAAPDQPGARVRRANGRAWIEGIPKLAWGRSGDCTFAGALEAALSVTKHPYSYVDIMGCTGLSFRFRWYQRTDAVEWCPSSAVGEFEDEIEAAAKATGWRLRVEHRMGPKEHDPHMENYAGEIRTAIDAGYPVLGYTEDLNMAVAYGYEERDGQLHFLWNSYMKQDEYILPDTKTGPMLVFLDDRETPMDRRDALRMALTTRAWRRDSLDATTPEKTASYLYGEQALRAWRDDLAQVDRFSVEERKSLFFVSWYCFASLADARRTAAPFLNDHARDFDGDVASALGQAATLYGEEAAALGAVFGAGDAFLGPWTGKSLDEWTPEVREREVAVIEDILQREARAIDAVDQAVAALEAEANAV